jgi:hypothetical protein
MVNLVYEEELTKPLPVRVGAATTRPPTIPLGNPTRHI